MPPAELQGHLKEQLGFLDTSSALYDQGNESEAKRLAVAIRVLVHDKKDSPSLLERLGVQPTLQYWSTSPNPPSASTVGDYQGISMGLGPDGAFRYMPNLRQPDRLLSFNEWWNDEPFFVKGPVRITRRIAVLTVSDKDGGAHVDPRRNEAQRRLLDTDIMGWRPVTLRKAAETVLHEQQISPNESIRVSAFELVTPPEPDPVTIDPAALVIVRTVAHELTGTIREQLSHLVT
jgi:hypothetical protein